MIFLFMVVYAPGGFAGLIMMNLRVMKAGAFFRLRTSYAGLLFAAVLMFAGAGSLVEMIYHLQLNAAIGPVLNFAGMALNMDSASTWIVAILVLLLGLAVFERVRKRFVLQWDEIQTELAQQALRKCRHEPKSLSGLEEFAQVVRQHGDHPGCGPCG